MKYLLAIFLFGIITLRAQPLQLLGFRLPEGRSSITVPIEISNNLIIIPVVINNQLPLKFILDTGVRTTILTEKSYSDILGLPYSRQYTIATPGDEHHITAYVTNNVTIYIPPGILGTGHSMLVLEKDYLELRNFLGTEVHGILGYELFSRFVVEIDYEGKKMELMDPKSFKPKRKFHQLPITIEDTKPFLNTNVSLPKRKNLKLLVDTGASHGLLLDPASDNEIQIPEKHINSSIGRALGGDITGQMGRIESLEMGKYILPKVIVSYPDPNSYMDTLKASSVIRNGSIGGEILTRFTVTFNYPGGKMYLKKNGSFKKEFQNNLSGLTLKAKGAQLRVFEVIQVREKSVSARADIRKGDIVISINGKQAEDFNLNEILGEINVKPGKKVVFLIDRDGVQLKKELILESEI